MRLLKDVTNIKDITSGVRHLMGSSHTGDTEGMIAHSDVDVNGNDYVVNLPPPVDMDSRLGDGWTEVAAFQMRGVKDVVTEKVFVQDKFASEHAGDGSWGVSKETLDEFANDPFTRRWTVFVEPFVVRTMTAVRLPHVQPISETADNASVRKNLKNLFKSFGKVYNKTDGLPVVFNAADAGKMMMQSGVDMRTFAPHIKSLYEGSIKFAYAPQGDFDGHRFRENVTEFDYYVNRFSTPDGEYFVRFIVRHLTDARDHVYGAAVTDAMLYKKIAEARTPANKLGLNHRDFSDKILSHFLDKGNNVVNESLPMGVIAEC